MYPILLTIHSIVAVILILIVMIQSGRSGGLSGLMGGGGGDALFSTSGQQAGIRKATVIVAIIFMFTSFGLTILSSRKSGQSVFNRPVRSLPQVPGAAPQQPAPPAGESEPPTGSDSTKP